MALFNKVLTALHGSKFGFSEKDSNGHEVLVHEQGKGIEFGGAGVSKQFVTKTITSAQVLALNATPIELIAAPGSGKALILNRITIHKPAGTAYAGVASGEDLVAKYTNASGVQVSSVIEVTGFLDQATAQVRTAIAPASTTTTAGDVAVVTNAAIVLHLLTGEIITGNSPLYVKCEYEVIDFGFTS